MSGHVTRGLALVVTASAGLLAGRATAPAPAPVAPVATAAPRAGAPAAICVAHLGDADVERIRDEVRRALGDRAPAGGSPLPPTAEVAGVAEAVAPALTVAQAERLAAVEDRIDTALAAGHWTAADVAVLRAASAQVPADAYVAAVQRLGVAINDGRLRIDPETGPY